MGETFYALRVCDRADTARWWASARGAVQTAPPAIRAVLAGRTRVEITCDEAWAVLNWARRLDGWPADGPSPLRIYPVGEGGG